MYIDASTYLGVYFDPDACYGEGPIKWLIGLFKRKKP